MKPYEPLLLFLSLLTVLCGRVPARSGMLLSRPTNCAPVVEKVVTSYTSVKILKSESSEFKLWCEDEDVREWGSWQTLQNFKTLPHLLTFLSHVRLIFISTVGPTPMSPHYFTMSLSYIFWLNFFDWVTSSGKNDMLDVKINVTISDALMFKHL